MNTLGQELILALKEHGAREIFGIPGDYALHLFKTIEDTKILPLYTLSHEPGVGFAADASARMNSSISVACVTYGVGGLNMVNAIAGAYAEKVPVVVISGAPAAGFKNSNLQLHHEVKDVASQYRVFKEITCAQAVINHVEEAPEKISKTLHACIKHSRPVYIEVPKDLVYAECYPIKRHEEEKPDLELIQSCADRVMGCLKTAKRPVIMVGEEAKRYKLIDKISDFAKATGIPLITSMLGIGIFEREKHLVEGSYKGVLSSKGIKDMMINSDLLFLLGVFVTDANFSPALSELPEEKTIHFFDRKLRVKGETFPQIEPEKFLSYLLGKAKKHPSCNLYKKTKEQFSEKLVADNEKITQIDIASGINELLDNYGNIPVCADIGDCMFTSLSIKDTARIVEWRYGSMGYSIPAGLGIQASTSKRPIILVGDGAFEMTGMELCNCQKYGWDPIVIVFNNQSWGILKAILPDTEFDVLPKLNFVKLSESLGGIGVRVETRAQLKEALLQLIKQGVNSS